MTMKKIILSVLLFVFLQVGLHAQCNFSAPTVNPVEVCQNVSIPDIVASTTETVDEWKWYQADGVTPIVNNLATFASGVNNAIAGTTTFYVSFLATDAVSLLQCESVKAEVTVTINALPTVTLVSSPSSTICIEQAATLIAYPASGTAPYTYLWTGKNLTNPTSSTPYYSPNSAGTELFNVTVTDSKSCSVNGSTSVTVNPLPTITATSNSPICAGQNLSLTCTPSATAGAVYYWTGPAGAFTPTTSSQQNPTVSYAGTWASGVYSVTLAVTVNGCLSEVTTTTNVVVNQPAAPIVMSPISYCYGSVASPLTASGTNLKWYTTASGGTPIGIAPTPQVIAAGTQNYWVSQTVNGCESPRAQIIVIVNPSLIPTITANPGFTVCPGTAINLSATGGIFTSYTWSGTAAAQIGGGATIASPTFAANAPAGTYTISLQVTDANACSGSTTQTITVKPTPATPVISTNPVCAGMPLQLVTPTVVGATYAWTGPNGFTSTVQNPTIPNANTFNSGSYCLTQTVNGCSNTSQACQTAIVYQNPQITITPSRIDACKSGNNSAVITMSTTGTSAGGTFVYTSVPVGISSMTGALDPAIASVGDYTITLNYTDLNGCFGTATTNAVIHAIPTVTYSASNPTTKCIYDAPFTIAVSPIPVLPATGIFSGAVTSSTFNPAISSIGVNNILYTYRDQYGCENTTTGSVEVKQIAPPIVTSGNPKIVIPQVDDTFLPGDNTDLTATGANTIQWMDGNCSIINGVGGTYATGKGPLDLGTWSYKVRQFDAVSGCASNCVNAEISISKCPAITPSAIDPYYCVGEPSPITVTATANGTQNVGDKLVWFSTANTALTPIPGFDGASTYSEAISTAAPTTKTIYVAQYNAANVCYSLPRAVTINVVANPTVDLYVLSDVCSGDGVVVNISVTPNNGILTATGQGAAGLNSVARTWDPNNGGLPAPSKAINLSYMVTETQPDGHTCSTTKTATSVAHYMAPPVAENKYWLIDDIANIPAGFMTASTSSTGVSIKWYTSQAMTTLLPTAPFSAGTLAADRLALQAELTASGATTTYTKYYWITQTDASGCESASTLVSIMLSNCPFMAPTVVSAEGCEGTVLPNITAAKPVSMIESVDNWNWYSTSSGGSPLYTGSNSYAHGVNSVVAASTTFYVSYTATETISGKQCESPRVPVSVIVYPKPNITITAPSVVCYDQGNVPLTKTVDYYTNGVGTGTWTLDGGTSGITTNGVFDPLFQGQVSDTYTLGYSYTDGKGCSNSATKTIDVQYTPAPSTIGHLSMTIANPTVKVEAISLLPAASVKWYSVTNTYLSSANPYITGDPSNIPTNKIYRASQVVKGCESQKTDASVQIFDCPVPAPNVIQPSSIFVGDAIPQLQASIGSPWGSGSRPTPVLPLEFRYYDSQTSSIPLVNNMSGLYTPAISSAIQGTYTYYVSEYNANIVPQGCEGPRTAVTISVLCNQPSPQVNLSAVTIQIPEVVPQINCTSTLTSNEEIWWECNGEKVSGNLSYTPNISEPGNYEMVVYIKNLQSQCTSQKVTIPITITACKPLPTVISDTVITIFMNQQMPTFEVQEALTIWQDSHNNQIAEGTTYTPQITQPGVYTFYAQQKEGTCVSKLKPFVVTVNSFKVSGKVFYDRNEDGIYQTTDVIVPNQMLYITETQEYISTNSKGEYVWNTVTSGTYTISMVNKVSGVQVLGSDVATVVIDAQHGIISDINFRYKVNPINDIYTDIYTSTPVVGRVFATYLYIKNNGQKQYNISVKATFDNTKCTFSSTNQSYISQTGNEIDFMLDSIEANSYKYIYVYLTVLPDWTLTNSTIKLTVDANTTNVDVTPTNNYDCVYAYIRNSSDPNDKAVTPALLDEGYVLMNSKLQYKIRFQNKGTAEAWDIYIKDTLDENLDISTFNLVTSSHDVHYTIQGRVVTFYFDNIMLPYEEADELGSNGFVVYDIYPIADLPEQSKVHNTAHIYFDFNPAVVTNTTNSTYVVTLPKEEEIGISDVQEDGIIIAPNPVKSTTTITVAKEGEKQITITDASGKIVMQLSGSQTEFKVDCSSLVSGVYMCTIVCNGIQYVEKIIVE